MSMPEPDGSSSQSEEDHAFRSRVIQWLLHRADAERPSEQPPRGSIPRVIVQYWHDLNALPDDVEACLESWRELEQCGFERRIFDDAHATSFIAENFPSDCVEAFGRCYHPAMRCDYFRLCYILKRGGFYVDADEVYQGTECDSLFEDERIKLQPLCYDMRTDQMVAPEEFLIDTEVSSSRIFYVNNNPIIAPPGHELVRSALWRSTRILLRGSERPEIQSTTGPGNLSASLVHHVCRMQRTNRGWDFSLLRDWQSISVCEWFLSYRNDERNWRFLNTPECG